MNEEHQIRIEVRKTLVDGKIIHEFMLVEWDEGEAGPEVYGAIHMSAKQARIVGKNLRSLSAPDPRPGRRILRAFLENPIALAYHTIRALRNLRRGEE